MYWHLSLLSSKQMIDINITNTVVRNIWLETTLFQPEEE